MNILENTIYGYEWEIIVLIIFLLLISVSKAYYPKRFSQLLMSLPFSRVAGQVLREEKVYTQRGQFLLQFSFFIIAPLFLMYMLKYLFRVNYTEVYFTDYLVFLAFFLLAYFIKTVSHLVLSKLFGSLELLKEYLFSIYTINAILGLLLAFILIIQLFMLNHNVNVYIASLIVIAVLFVFRLIRGIFLIISKNYPLFYGFLYLCTLEILPLVVMFKILSNNLA